MSFPQVLLRSADPAAPAVLHGDRALSYAELERGVSGVAAELLVRGFQKGERIGILAENSAFFVRAYLGIMTAGLVAVPFQTEVAAEAFEEIAASTDLRLIFVSDRHLKRVRCWAGQTRLVVVTEREIEEWRAVPGVGLPEIDERRDLAALMFTSGSTGAPRGVMVTHWNLRCNTRDIAAYLGLTARDRAMVVLPFHYCFGLSLLHSHLWAGASVVLNNDFKLFPETVLAEMREKQCTGLAGVPSTYQILLRRSRFRELEFPHLRWLQQAGGKLPAPCIREILEAFPSVSFFLMYGQTEATARLSYLPPERLADKLGSIGHGLPSARLEVLRPDGSPVRPGSEEVGEIVAAGDSVTLGYWRDPQETAKYFRHGRLHTGDLARVDDEGFIFIVEREREIIKSGGNRISAKEVEEVIAELPEVMEVAVIGVSHDILGEAIQAAVVPAPTASLTPLQVLSHCRKRLPGYKVPQDVILLKSLIHNSAGKVLKTELKKLLERPAAESAATQSYSYANAN